MKTVQCNNLIDQGNVCNGERLLGTSLGHFNDDIHALCRAIKT